MVDETDISREIKWLYEQHAKIAIGNFQKRGVNAQYVSSREEARDAVIDMIPEGVLVARGDSITIDQIGVIPVLEERRQNVIIDPLERDADGYFRYTAEERKKLSREAFLADIFLVGSNAVTLDGKLVNIDGAGNRVSAMIFGPDKVIVVVGANKIVKDVNEALDRIHNFAAPMNARRHQLKHHAENFGELPCVRTGVCIDCFHKWRICRYTVIIEGEMGQDRGRINVVLVGEELGL
jgi:L-lactate utilization protein LutB